MFTLSCSGNISKQNYPPLRDSIKYLFIDLGGEKPLKMFTRLSQPDSDKYSTKNVYPSSELSPAPLLCGR